jgi:hypothetical protein
MAEQITQSFIMQMMLSSQVPQSAINSALQVIGIDEKNAFASSLTVSPNPASEKSEVKFSLLENARIEISLFDMRGAC